MTPEELKAFCALLMCSDPWPVKPDLGEQKILEDFADAQAKRLGFDGWIEAYHKL